MYLIGSSCTFEKGWSWSLRGPGVLNLALPTVSSFIVLRDLWFLLYCIKLWVWIWSGEARGDMCCTLSLLVSLNILFRCTVVDDILSVFILGYTLLALVPNACYLSIAVKAGIFLTSRMNPLLSLSLLEQRWVKCSSPVIYFNSIFLLACSSCWISLYFSL